MRLVVLILLLCPISEIFAENLFELLILHNNDMHGRFEETARNSATCRDKTTKNGKSSKGKRGCVGGFARTAHEIRRYRRMSEEGRGRPVLYLNAGDTYVGTAWFSVHKWKIVTDFLNVLEPDAMSLGNHEFDDGVAGLAPLINTVKSPIVAANLKFDKEPSLRAINKSVILEKAGRKIGIIGHLTEETKQISAPGLVEFLDVVKSVKEESEALDKAGVKIIIVLGHSGFEMDKRIAAEVPLVDVVIGGHTNTFQWNGPRPDDEKPEDLYPRVVVQPSGKKVPVVQAYAYTKYLGRLNVTFNDAGDLVEFEGQPELLDTPIPQDEDVLNLLEKYRPEVDALDKKVVGKSRVVLEATGNKCRERECNFGNLIADAFVYYMASISLIKTWTDTPIGLVNGGSIRSTIDPTLSNGNVTGGELLGAVPFGNQMISIQITGADLLKTLEIGARSNGETSKGEFLQVSGLKVIYDLSKPSFSRVVSVKTRCGQCRVPTYEPLVRDKLYHIITTSFLISGGDGHYVLRDNSLNKKYQDLGDVDMISWYIGKQSPVYPEEQGRIQFVKAEELITAGSSYVSVSGASFYAVLLIHLFKNVFY